MADKLDFTGGLALHCDKPHRKNGFLIHAITAMINFDALWQRRAKALTGPGAPMKYAYGTAAI
jgi:hypothetical protein